MLGVGPVLGSRHPDDEERIRLAVLFKAFYPAVAYQLERTASFYELPLPELKKLIIDKAPEMEKIFAEYSADKMKKETIYPGQEVWAVPDIGEKMRVNRAVGLMSGTSSRSSEEAARSLAGRLAFGALSSQDRFQASLMISGLSSEDDISRGGGQQIFLRCVTNENIKFPIRQFKFSDEMQLLYSTNALRRGAYGYPMDKFGTKNDYFYGNRKNLLEFPSQVDQVKDIIVENEVMVKHRIDPIYMDAVVVQHQSFKDEMVKVLEKETFICEGKKYQCMEKGQVFFITTINGKPEVRSKPIDSFILVAKQFNVNMWKNNQ